MNLDKYLSSLLPSFTKARMLEDLGVTREELKYNTLPPLKALSQTFGKRKWENEWVKNFDERFEKQSELRYSGNFMTGVYETLERALENCDSLERLINLTFADDVVREAMTVSRANILQYLEVMSFAISYSRRLMVIALTLEVAQVEQEDPTASSITPGELDWVTKRQDAFYQSMRILGNKKEDLEKQFADLPDMTINSDTVATTTALVGVTKIDPMGFGLIPISLNPIYHVRMAIADWQVSRFKAAQEEKRMLEFKLLQLKLASTGKKDVKLQQQVDYTQGRLQKLNFKLREMEDNYGTA